jgi:hypothetical protein
MGWCQQVYHWPSESVQSHYSSTVAIALDARKPNFRLIDKEWLISTIEHEMAHSLDLTKEPKNIEKINKARRSIFSGDSTRDDLLEYYNDPTEIVARLRQYSNLLKRNFKTEQQYQDLNKEQTKTRWFNEQISKIKSNYEFWKYLTQENKNKFLSVLYSEWQKLCGNGIEKKESKVQKYIAEKRTSVVARYWSIALSK